MLAADITYFYAKLGAGNALADQCLGGKNPIGRPAVPIFFDLRASSRDQFLEEGSANEQGRNFFWSADNPDRARIVAIHDAKLFIARPVDDVVFWRCAEQFGYADCGDYVKFLPVEVLRRVSFRSAPLILCSMSANRYYYTGTYRRIADEGNTRALDCMLGRSPAPVETPRDLLKCLGSIELETLVAKIFEAAGCFVPAYRGGAMKGVDILARNPGNTAVRALGVWIAPQEGKAIQVKRSTSAVSPPPGCDHIVSAERDSELLLKEALSSTEVAAWLGSSLEWLPSGTLERFGLTRSSAGSVANEA